MFSSNKVAGSETVSVNLAVRVLVRVASLILAEVTIVVAAVRQSAVLNCQGNRNQMDAMRGLHLRGSKHLYKHVSDSRLEG